MAQTYPVVANVIPIENQPPTPTHVIRCPVVRWRGYSMGVGECGRMLARITSGSGLIEVVERACTDCRRVHRRFEVRLSASGSVE